MIHGTPPFVGTLIADPPPTHGTGQLRYDKRRMKNRYTVASLDEVLIRACREGDAEAWKSLLRKYERLVFSIPLNYGLSREDAADISQLTFTILLESIEKLPENSRLGGWLATVARRHTWRLMKRNRQEVTDRYADLAESATLLSGSDTEFAEPWELTEWLDQGLSRITERCQTLLFLLYFRPEQPSYAEIAAQLGMPVGSIGPTRARCLQLLKQTLTGNAP